MAKLKKSAKKFAKKHLEGAIQRRRSAQRVKGFKAAKGACARSIERPRAGRGVAAAHLAPGAERWSFLAGAFLEDCCAAADRWLLGCHRCGAAPHP
jgi:hypothetical protein